MSGAVNFAPGASFGKQGNTVGVESPVEVYAVEAVVVYHVGVKAAVAREIYVLEEKSVQRWADLGTRFACAHGDSGRVLLWRLAKGLSDAHCEAFCSRAAMHLEGRGGPASAKPH